MGWIAGHVRRSGKGRIGVMICPQSPAGVSAHGVRSFHELAASLGLVEAASV